RQIGTRDNGSIGGDAVAFRQYQEVAAHHCAAGNAPPGSVAYDQRAWASEIAERREGALRLALLIERDPGHQEYEPQQDQRFLQITKDDVDRPARQEEEEHGFAQHIGETRAYAEPIAGG